MKFLKINKLKLVIITLKITIWLEPYGPNRDVFRRLRRYIWLYSNTNYLLLDYCYAVVWGQ